MGIDAEALLAMFESNTGRIRSLVEGVTPEQGRWKPDPKSWSILEVINHLYDEEREDFRVRLDIILHRPDQAWPPIDPQGWVTSRAYQERELAPSLQSFLDERASSLDWLRGLTVSDWQAGYQTRFGLIRAGDMFAAWVAHDTLHMRQLVELHRAYILLLTEGYDTQYAGEW
jgi:hypothetical protein